MKKRKCRPYANVDVAESLASWKEEQQTTE